MCLDEECNNSSFHLMTEYWFIAQEAKAHTLKQVSSIRSKYWYQQVYPQVSKGNSLQPANWFFQRKIIEDNVIQGNFALNYEGPAVSQHIWARSKQSDDLEKVKLNHFQRLHVRNWSGESWALHACVSTFVERHP